MENTIKKFRDRLRIIIILYTFCDKEENNNGQYFGTFRTEIRIQALDFLVRYPDFLSMELMDLMNSDTSINPEAIQQIISDIYKKKEPVLRVEEMEKFFHGAYESLDDVVAYLVSIGFLKYESKKRTDGNTYDRIYRITLECAQRIEHFLKTIDSVKWYFQRCELIGKYFGQFTGSELKQRQYRYSEYSDISYKSHIKNINEKVKVTFENHFNKSLV